MRGKYSWFFSLFAVVEEKEEKAIWDRATDVEIIARHNRSSASGSLLCGTQYPKNTMN